MYDHIGSGNSRWEQVKHLPVVVHTNVKHPFNLLQVQAFALGSGEEAEPVELGSVSFHVHDLIASSQVQGWFDLTNGSLLSGEVALELMFHYGMFGYGYSTQLLEPTREPQDLIRNSLFPRIAPPRDRIDKHRQTIVPRAVKHPNFLLADERAIIGFGKQAEALLDTVDARKEPELLPQVMARYARSKSRLDALKPAGRLSRLMYIQSRILAASQRSETIHKERTVNERLHARKTYLAFVQATRMRSEEQVTGGNIPRLDTSTILNHHASVASLASLNSRATDDGEDDSVPAPPVALTHGNSSSSSGPSLWSKIGNALSAVGAFVSPAPAQPTIPGAIQSISPKPSSVGFPFQKPSNAFMTPSPSGPLPVTPRAPHIRNMSLAHQGSVSSTGSRKAFPTLKASASRPRRW